RERLARGLDSRMFSPFGASPHGDQFRNGAFGQLNSLIYIQRSIDDMRGVYDMNAGHRSGHRGQFARVVQSWNCEHVADPADLETQDVRWLETGIHSRQRRKEALLYILVRLVEQRIVRSNV